MFKFIYNGVEIASNYTHLVSEWERLLLAKIKFLGVEVHNLRLRKTSSLCKKWSSITNLNQRPSTKDMTVTPHMYARLVDALIGSEKKKTQVDDIYLGASSCQSVKCDILLPRNVIDLFACLGIAQNRDKRLCQVLMKYIFICQLVGVRLINKWRTRSSEPKCPSLLRVPAG